MHKLTVEELNRIDIDTFKSSKKIPLTIVLDNIRSLYNVGSIFRTADAFRLEKIWLCGITGCPPNQDIHKTALGAQDSMDWEYESSTEKVVELLQNKGYIVLAIEQVEQSIMLDKLEIDKSKHYALVFGNEVKGVGQSVVDASDKCVEIPQFGTKHSLNVSVSAGIAIWDIVKKMGFEQM